MFPSDFQRDIPRRALQDTRRPQSAWGTDRTEHDPEDYYPEAHLPKPASNPRRKIPFVSLDSDSSSDDCRVVITDAVPLNTLPPDPTPPSDSGKRKAPATATEGPSADAPSASSRGGRRHGTKTGTRKRSAPPTHQTTEEPSEDAEASAPASKRIKKTAGRKQFKRTVYDG